jgi:hypothetical protein
LEPALLDTIDERIVRAHRPRSAFGDSLQDCWKVCRRRSDDAQDLTRRALLFQRLGEPIPQGVILRLKLRDPRVWIVRHLIHPGHPALLRDGARIARGTGGAL